MLEYLETCIQHNIDRQIHTHELDVIDTVIIYFPTNEAVKHHKCVISLFNYEITIKVDLAETIARLS